MPKYKRAIQLFRIAQDDIVIFYFHFKHILYEVSCYSKPNDLIVISIVNAIPGIYIVCPYRWGFSKASFGYMYSLYVIFCQRQSKFAWNIYVIWNTWLISNIILYTRRYMISLYVYEFKWHIGIKYHVSSNFFRSDFTSKDIKRKANMSRCWFECEIDWNKCKKPYFKSDFVVILYNSEWNTTANHL